MIVCPYCKRELLEGTLFCPECGASLATQEGAAPAGREEVAPAEEEEGDEGSGRTTARISLSQLRLLILNSGRMVACPQQEVILLGRLDPAGGIFPEVDLTQDNGYMAGVSRRHARIIRRGDDFFLEDLESINGTFLNRKRVPANTLVPFEDGDEIRLGNLVLRVILEKDLV